jgi:hypothetical protein
MVGMKLNASVIFVIIKSPVIDCAPGDAGDARQPDQARCKSASCAPKSGEEPVRIQPEIGVDNLSLRIHNGKPWSSSRTVIFHERRVSLALERQIVAKRNFQTVFLLIDT